MKGAQNPNPGGSRGFLPPHVTFTGDIVMKEEEGEMTLSHLRTQTERVMAVPEPQDEVIQPDSDLGGHN